MKSIPHPFHSYAESSPPLPVYTGAHTVIYLQLINKIHVHDLYELLINVAG